MWWVHSAAITFGPCGPVLVISPTFVTNPSYTLAYTVTDGVDGVQQVSEQVTLVEGENVLKRVLTDLAGSIRTESFTVTLDAP